MSETRDTAHSKNVNKLVSKVDILSLQLGYGFRSSQITFGFWLFFFWSFGLATSSSFFLARTFNSSLSQTLYKAKFEKEKGKSEYNNMTVPPDVQHAIDVAKCQSSVSLLYWYTLRFSLTRSLVSLYNPCRSAVALPFELNSCSIRRTPRPTWATPLWWIVPTSGRPPRLPN